MRGRPCGNKKIQGRKRFIVTDVLGLLLALSITEANIGEQAGAVGVLSKLGDRFSRLKTILADQGFDRVEFITKNQGTIGFSAGGGLPSFRGQRLYRSAQTAPADRMDCRANLCGAAHAVGFHFIVGSPKITKSN